MVNTAEGICSHDFVSWECVISVFRTKDENQTRRQIEGPTVNLFFNRMTGPYLGRKERPGDTTAWLPYHSLFSIPSVCTLQEFIKKKNKRAANVPSKRKSVHAVLETWMHMANWPACGINSKRRFAVWMVSTERARLGSGWSGGYEALFKTEQSTVLMQKLSGQPALLGTYGIVLVPASLSANPWWWLIDFEPNSVILWGPDCCVCLCRYL